MVRAAGNSATFVISAELAEQAVSFAGHHRPASESLQYQPLPGAAATAALHAARIQALSAGRESRQDASWLKIGPSGA